MKMPEIPADAGPNGGHCETAGRERADADLGLDQAQGDGEKLIRFSKFASHALKIPGRVDVSSWHGKSAPERRWLVDGLLPEGNVTLLAGEGGIGKSVLALQLISACALGKTWIGRHARPCKVIGVFCEDDEAEIWRRLEAVARHYETSVSDLAEQVALWSRVGLDNLLMTWRDQYCQGETTDIFTQISNVARDSGAELVVLDALHDFFGGNENNRAHARQFIGELRGLAMDIGGTVLLTAHPSLTGRNTGTGEAGSTAWNNAVRSRLYLTTPKSEEDQDDAPNGIRELKSMKSNYGPPGGRIRLRWEAGVFVPDQPAGGIFGTIERRTAEQAFLDCLDALEKRGLRVNAIRNQPNYAPRQMLGMSAAKGFTRADLELAMKRALEAGKIEVVTEGPPSRQRSHLARVDQKEEPDEHI